jgi:hypothetical protein
VRCPPRSGQSERQAKAQQVRDEDEDSSKEHDYDEGEGRRQRQPAAKLKSVTDGQVHAHCPKIKMGAPLKEIGPQSLGQQQVVTAAVNEGVGILRMPLAMEQ